MPDLSLIVLIVLVLLAWFLLAASLALVVFVIPRRRSDLNRELGGDPLVGDVDRRTASRDRRVGLPDTRAVPTERRSGTRDRRRGPAAMA